MPLGGKREQNGTQPPQEKSEPSQKLPESITTQSTGKMYLSGAADFVDE